jgi:flagellar biosynthesis protein FlhF
LVLIDTAGINPLKPDDMTALADLAAAAKAEPVLTLAAGGDVSESGEQGQLFSEIGCQRMIATRIDAARRYGALLACAEGGKLGFAEFGISPEIGNGLMFFGADALARLLMPQEMAEGPKREQNGVNAARVDERFEGMARKKPGSEGASGSRKRPVGSKT